MNLKKTFSIFLISVISLFAFNANLFSQSKIDTVVATKNYAVLAQTAGHFRKAVRTAETLKETRNWNDFQIMLCAKLVGELPNNTELIPFFEKAQKLGVKMVVCGLSMANFNVDKSQLHPSLEVTPNAFIYTFDLQEKGYNTLVF